MDKRRKAKGGGVLLTLLVTAVIAGAGWFGWRQWPGPAVIEKPIQIGSGVETNIVYRTPLSHVETSSPIRPTNAPVRETAAGIEPVTGRTNSQSGKSTAVLEAQIALDRLAISPGSIDGVMGSQTRAALRTFQGREKLPVTGELDAATRAQLSLPCATLTAHHVVQAADLDRLLPLPSTWLGKSEQPRLDYETILELMAERTHSHPNLIQRLNPGVNWASVATGTTISLPAIERVRPETKAAFLRIRLADRTLQAFDSTNRLLAHFPCSIAARVEKRPVGELSVTVVVPNPDYLFNPENFSESAEARELGRKLRLSPGPNNPVGTAWIGLNLAGYGIHGTPKPEDVGRTESHGCFRLANWNAEHLLQLVTVGTRVLIEP